MSARNTTLDIAKGISILLMTITHMVVFSHYPAIRHINHEVLLVFKMPLFIFISGWLYSPKRTPGEFVAGKADGLLKPVATILGIGLLIVGIVQWSSAQGLLANVTNTIFTLSYYFLPLWFPVTLFVALVLFRALTGLWETATTRNSFFITTGVVLLLAVLWRTGWSLYILEFHSLLIFMIFLWAGWMVRRAGTLETMLGLGPFLFFASVFGVSIVFRDWLGVDLDINSNRMGNFVPTMIASFSGIMIVINLSRWLSRVRYVSRVFVWCSRGSFYILAFSPLLGNVFVQPFFDRWLPGGAIADALSWLVTIALCVALWRATFLTRGLKYILLPLKSVSLSAK